MPFDFCCLPKSARNQRGEVRLEFLLCRFNFWCSFLISRFLCLAMIQPLIGRSMHYTISKDCREAIDTKVWSLRWLPLLPYWLYCWRKHCSCWSKCWAFQTLLFWVYFLGLPQILQIVLRQFSWITVSCWWCVWDEPRKNQEVLVLPWGRWRGWTHEWGLDAFW